MKILAFSDWRVQDIEQFIDYLEKLEDNPDVIIYAGDDIERFNQVEYKFLPSDLKKEYRDRLISMDESYRELNKKILEEIIRQNEIEYKNESNKFEKIASFSKYGLFVVAGNDDPSYIKKAINGKNVYNVHDKTSFIEDLAIIGLEGATSKIGPLKYTEKEIKNLLEGKIEQVGERQIIIVSHSPPSGILDFAMRFGKEHIGSTSLRDFIEEYSDRIKLVISGHVHRQGGKFKKYKDIYIVNCASHDNYGAPGRIALIDITHDNIDINWEILYNLESVPLVGYKRAEILREHGIKNVKQLAALSTNDKLSQKVGSFYLIINYAKAIISNKIIVKKGIKSVFDNLEEENIYFFDAEYDPVGTRHGPFGIFVLGWMSKAGEVQQLFLDNPKDESKMLKDFSKWVDTEKPLFIAYASRSADVPHLRNSFARFGLPSKNLEKSFFDLYYDLIFTQNQQKQKYFLPVPDSLGLKNVSECLGYQSTSLVISDGIEAPLEYEKFLRKKSWKAKDKIKNDLLIYNRDDLNRTKFIFDLLKAKS